MKYNNSKIYIALPVLNELENIDIFIKDIKAQTLKNYYLYICVNQPDEWWNLNEKAEICRNNEKTIYYLKSLNDKRIVVIDKSSKTHGWKGKHSGVGWARKILMDTINEIAHENDIIVSLDADTRFNPEYFESIILNFNNSPSAMAVSIPYYHKLTENEDLNRAILRYEIYMRYYAINLWRINSPFKFTALGSAIACPLWAYRKIGGISPMKSGEDFYFLQKFCKVGKILNWNPEKVYPAARYSDRVFFGTGPALIKGNKGDWQTYPIFHYTFFDEILQSYVKFPELYYNDINYPMSDFLNAHFKDNKWWYLLRKNYKTEENFVKACYEKVDGLRTLQFLKNRQSSISLSDEECILDFLNKFYPKVISELEINKKFKFNELTIEKLDKLRNILMEIEEKYQNFF